MRIGTNRSISLTYVFVLILSILIALIKNKNLVRFITVLNLPILLINSSSLSRFWRIITYLIKQAKNSWYLFCVSIVGMRVLRLNRPYMNICVSLSRQLNYPSNFSWPVDPSKAFVWFYYAILNHFQESIIFQLFYRICQ